MQNGFLALPCISENKIMKKHITKLIGIALVAFYLLGCDDDELQPEDCGQTGMAVQFEGNQDELLEDAEEKLGKIKFGRKTTNSGTITWRLTHLQSVLRIPVRRTHCKRIAARGNTLRRGYLSLPLIKSYKSKAVKYKTKSTRGVYYCREVILI